MKFNTRLMKLPRFFSNLLFNFARKSSQVNKASDTYTCQVIRTADGKYVHLYLCMQGVGEWEQKKDWLPMSVK